MTVGEKSIASTVILIVTMTAIAVLTGHKAMALGVAIGTGAVCLLILPIMFELFDIFQSNNRALNKEEDECVKQQIVNIKTITMVQPSALGVI